ncbi:MAG: NAD-binding protein [Chitinophagaceae bacterium]|nr:NAD-binding protein [Chitinophagaceae bacterium]MBK9487267.1 NAD-binding protein [Chitinophagaceae bacterium]MBL0199656.1 NAD-binding protein [Chitinophagaceae bacterium]
MLQIKRLRLFSRLILPIAMLVLTILFGTAGYMAIESFSFLEALYMTVITISTVGFTEVRPLSESGRIFTIFLILVNLGLFTYFVTLLTRFFSDGEFTKLYKQIKMENSIQQLQQHVIICGFGRNGKESAQILFNNKIPFVVLEEKNELETDLDFDVSYFMKGDATKDEVLLEAGIKNARALITTLPVDADNLFVVLTAKQLNPNVKVISRASQDSSVKKLKIAGADNVIMPDKIGGAHMATLVILPDVVEMLSIMSTQSTDRFRVAEIQSNKNISLGELDMWSKTNCTILGIKNPGNHYTINPDASYQINPGERLIVMGSDEQIEKAKKLL